MWIVETQIYSVIVQKVFLNRKFIGCVCCVCCVTPFKMIYMGEHCFTGPTRPRIIHRQAFLLQHTGIQTVLLYENNASLNGKVTF